MSIRLSNLCFSYSGRRVLEDISLEIPVGTYYGIVGPNGSGKTTLAYIITGILHPEEGNIDTGGAKVGLILANPENQIVSLVVEEDVAFGPENLGLAPDYISTRVLDALVATGSLGLRYALTTNLSGGELAKIAFAGQMAMEVDTLVLDEGTVHLDPAGRTVLFETLKRLNQDESKTVIHISHRLDDLEAATEVVCLADGQIKFGAPGVMSLISTPHKGSVYGVELGSRLIYKRFLSDAGIDVFLIRDATYRLAEALKQKD
ncbi:MAG: ATP-binding cassette domain-containing protein [Thermodesulfobacteriota bacterium]|nr:ATP-binding cassette domain-containing protein [Thermodesulfobacteriota bacterium]